MEKASNAISKVKNTSQDLLKTERSRFSDDGSLASMLNFNKKKQLKTFQCSSSVLGKIRDFIPKFEESEQALKRKSADDVNVENIESCAGNIIEMDVALYEMSSSDESDNCSSEGSHSDACSSEEELSDDELNILGRNKLRLSEKTRNNSSLIEVLNSEKTSDH